VGMRARARSAGGELELKSQPGQGVTIEVWAPLGSRDAAQMEQETR
jgi:signal transduction histidine kinase